MLILYNLYYTSGPTCLYVAILCCLYDSFGTRLHATKEIDTPLRFLETAHPNAVSKSRDYFSRKLMELYQQKGRFSKQRSIPSNALLAPYKVAHRIAKCEETHTIAEELILPAAVDMVNLMIGESVGFCSLALMK